MEPQQNARVLGFKMAALRNLADRASPMFTHRIQVPAHARCFGKQDTLHLPCPCRVSILGIFVLTSPVAW